MSKKQLKNYKQNKSPGPDNIFNEFIINGGESLYLTLAIFYNTCLDKCLFPDDLKLSNIIPLYKKSKRCMCNNYRPVKLLSIIGKLFERIIANRLQPFLENEFLNKGQAGFRPKFSTVEQIIFTLEEINKTLDQGNDVIECFLDISKAFDRIWQKGMMYKRYHHIGIRGRMFLLLNNYFNDRFSRVRINEEYSYIFIKDIWVPQGSVLEVFLMFLNDLLNEIKCRKSCFVDE